jgi:16S rRNA processing protein RimM
MSFTKIGIIKKDKYSKDLIEFTSSTKNNTTIKSIDNFILMRNSERYTIKFKIKSNEKNKYLLEIDSKSKKFVEELKGISEIFIENKYLPILEKDEFYNDELVECNAIDENEIIYGKIIKIIDSSNGSILEIQNKEKTFLVPFNESFIINVDIEYKKITIKNIANLAEL